MLEDLANELTGLPPPAFWLLAMLVTALAAGGFHGAFRFLRRARVILDTPTAKIRSAAQGYLELDGRSELMEGQPIIAPLTGKTCTWYRYKVERREVRHSNGKRHETWRTVDKGVSDNLFLVVDDTGQCVIDPDGAEVTCSAHDRWHGHSSRTAGAQMASGPLRLGTGNYRYSEERIHPGEPLYAIGLFNTVGGAGDLGNTREEMHAVLRAWKQDKAGLIRRFDANGDGEVDANEWDEARKEARKEVLQARSERLASAGTNLMTKPADRRRPYLLSVVPQHDLARRFHWFAAGSLLLFFLAGGATTWMLGVRFAG